MKTKPQVIFFQRYGNADFWDRVFTRISDPDLPKKFAALGHVTAVCVGENRNLPPKGDDLKWFKKDGVTL